MSSAMPTANFPTLVPPNFCTSHLASGSILFWCRFGGVLGRDDVIERDENEVDLEYSGDGVADILNSVCDKKI